MAYNSGIELRKVAFSTLTYQLIPAGSFYTGYDLDNGGVLSKIDNLGNIIVIEGGTSLYDEGTGTNSTVRNVGNNIASCNYSIVSGGLNNTSSGFYSTVTGGTNNTASSRYTNVSGGGSNNASQFSASVGGGFANTASGYYSVVAGGRCNIAKGNYSTTSGGRCNTASGHYSTVTGGWCNTVSGNYSTVSGYCNTASGYGGFTTGLYNIISNFATTAIGRSNTVSGQYSTTIGQCNLITGINSFATGFCNTISSCYSTISGKCGYSYLNDSKTFSSNKIDYVGDSQVTETIIPGGFTGGSGSSMIPGWNLIPDGTDRLWNVIVKWSAVVSDITGTATGVTIGDYAIGSHTFGLNKVASVISTSATTQIYRIDNGSMSGFIVTFNPTANQLVQLTLPSFSGGGTITVKVSFKFELIEVAK